MTNFSNPLGQRRALLLITRREFKARVVSRAFLVGMLTTVLLIFGIFGLGSLFGGDDPVRVGLVGSQPFTAEANLREIAELQGTTVEIDGGLTRSDAEQRLTDGALDAVVIDGRELLMNSRNNEVAGLVSPAWSQASLIAGLSDQGLDADEIRAALGSADGLAIVELDPDPDSDSRQTVAFASVILTFIAIQIAGAYIMMGVFEEKSSKVVELVLASLPARYLLAGKVLGVGAAGLIQVLVLAGSAIGAATLFTSDGLPALTVGTVALAIVWFLLGYLLYGAVFAAGASLAPRQEDAQSTLGPVSVVLMLGYFGSIFAASSPGSTLATVISWLPITAPFAMPGRIADGSAEWWEVVGSMGVTAAAVVVVLIFAERIYVRSVIHTDRTLGWREAWSLGT